MVTSKKLIDEQYLPLCWARIRKAVLYVKEILGRFLDNFSTRSTVGGLKILGASTDKMIATG
jgi:hypothetical protein